MAIARKQVVFELLGLNRMKFSVSAVPALILISIGSLIQSYLLRHHSEVGDGIFYSSTFDALHGVGLVDGYHLFQDGLGASEFFSYLIFYVSAQILSYDIFVGVTNLALALSIYLVYRKYEKGILLYVLTVPFNFYFLATCFGAQRLKLGILFLVLSVLASDLGKRRIFAALSLFSHFQLVIIFVAEKIRAVFAGTARVPLLESALFAGMCASLFFTVPALQFKVYTYLLQRDELNLFTFFASFLVAVYASRFNLGIIVEFLFFLAVALVIGESRVNILVFLVLWRLIFLERQYPALVAYVISLYLSWKGLGFMIDIASGGSGFGTP